jgi:hypothetical protein
MLVIFNKLQSPKILLEKCTSEETLIKYLTDDVYKDLKIGLSAYKLLAYILATNRTLMRELKDHERIPFNPEGYFK